MEALPTADALATLVVETAESEDPAARLRRAVQVSAELGTRGDELLERFVSSAREAGLSWTEIGAAFGTSKQAAQKRYGAATVAPGAWPGPWDSPARHALETASEHARALGHSHVGTEHVLLGLLDARDGMAADVLADLGVTRQGVLAQALAVPLEPSRSASLAIMPRLKRALELALRVADGLGDDCARTEHVLVAITQVADALAIELLGCLGVSAQDVLHAVAERIGVDPAALVPARRRRRRRLRAVR